MKFPSTFLAWLLVCCLPFQIFGQKNTLSNAYLVKTYTFYKNPDPSLNHLNYFEAMASKMHLSPQSKMVLQEELPGEKGYTHFKYQQLHEGLPIFGSHYILHEKDGKVVTATGNYSPQVNVSATPGINAATAAAFARQAMKAREYDAQKIEPILCFIDPAFPKVSETVRLAYQVDLHSTAPFDKRRYFVDASSGKIINQFPLILREGVPSTAKTRYYGVKNITTDSIAPQEFVLRDPTRGIFVYNGDGENFTSTSSTWDLANAQKDEVALDAHYCTQEYYNMMLADYNWQGQDGQGKALKAYVHDGDYVNAFWDGESTVYGDGDCNYGPLTTLEVMGHEFTHGMVQYTSGLVYNGESGAINESLADIFGKLLEHQKDPTNFSWVLGHSFILGPNVLPLRILNDPNSLEMPAYYQGMFWMDGNDVHSNSAIGNLWFSMLVDGKQGFNEEGIAFNVPALDIDKIGQIIFQVNKNYFTENSDYHAFYQYSLQVAEELYGANSTEVQAVREAWKAVGLPGVVSASLDLALPGFFFSNEKFCSPGQYLPVRLKITNPGTVAYNPSIMATVTLTSASLPAYTVPLNSAIAPGEVFEVQVDNWLETPTSGYATVSATLNLIDGNLDNNYWYNFYNVVEFPANDLSLSSYSIPQKCFTETQRIGLFVTNNSCETVPVGTILNFTATDEEDNLLWTAPPYTLDQELPASSTIFIDFEMPAANSVFHFNLVYPEDPNPGNNQSEDNAADNLAITSNYLNTFEIDYGQDNYLALPDASLSNVLYQNNHYFAATGQAEDPTDFQRCPDITNIFTLEDAQGLTANIHACLDFSLSPVPTLEFDLVQFRNALAASSNDPYSTMLQAKWRGNENGEQIIFGQTEGMVKHHNISLPPFFKGALDFKFYAEVGNWFPEPTYFYEDDFLLLDNLRLSAPTSGINELNANFPVLLSPNPAQERTTIQAADGIKTILLRNINGQIMQTLQVNANTCDLDLKGLTNGFYLLNIQLNNGQQGVKKLVKMD